MRNPVFILIVLLVLSILFAACSRVEKPLKIAVSYVSGKPETNNYLEWLGRIAPEAELLAMNELSNDSVELVFKQCHGLLLTGGDDVYPGRYGKEEDTARCGEFNLVRDTLEFRLIELAMEREVPVLGICRGQQILNVALGGTLYVDIPSDLNSTIVHQQEDWKNCYHSVLVFPKSLLSNISGVDKEVVNSNHHQAVERLADKLRVLAVSEDGVIESIGWADTINNPFLLGVQWHPERMDTLSVLSTPIAERFIKEAIKFKD
ncbi:MAG: gamma-glutamyl-gamma-aminobutyrate hydrolase family protein [Bacteroidales bacterium]|nr:gamma-glutamyl-gamma-aminobutyrate hydrolase family protein [Bacteroidales bacterium]